MVFTKLSLQEKEAFFGLLDEYFQSRPEIFGQGGDGGTGISTTAAASAVQRALHAANTTSAPKSNNPYTASMHQQGISADHVAQAMPAIGRVAAASLAFSGGTGTGTGGGTSGTAPSTSGPSLPRRLALTSAPASTSVASLAAAHALPGQEVDKLVTRKTSVLSAFKKPVGAGTTMPSAFVAPKNAFGPPPVRRATSDTGAEQRQASEPEPAAGEWAEVLYDYSSEDAGDLAIEAGTRVLVTARSSEDWWTGQIEGQGREGLFPASYVKLL